MTALLAHPPVDALHGAVAARSILAEGGGRYQERLAARQAGSLDRTPPLSVGRNDEQFTRLDHEMSVVVAPVAARDEVRRIVVPRVRVDMIDNELSSLVGMVPDDTLTAPVAEVRSCTDLVPHDHAMFPHADCLTAVGVGAERRIDSSDRMVDRHTGALVPAHTQMLHGFIRTSVQEGSP